MRLKVGTRGAFEDVPRLPDGTALIGDARNDENVAVNGLHAAFLAFHNKVLETGAAAELPRGAPARDLALAVAGAQRVPAGDDRRRARPRRCSAATGGCGAGCRTPFIPVEFQGAAYRFGHSQVRPSYRMNFTGAADGGQRFAFVFDPRRSTRPTRRDMQGGFAGPGRHIGWPTFFRFDDDRAQCTRPNKTIDTKLSSPLFHLPPKTVRGPEDVLSLAQRNLLRHLTWSLPSGQAIAKAVGVPALSPDQLAELAPIYAPFTRSTPLWYYVLKEAARDGGRRRGSARSAG